MKGHFNATQGAGQSRGGGPADFTAAATPAQRGAWDSEQDPSSDPSQQNLTSDNPPQAHSTRGFKRALMKASRGGNSLSQHMPSKSNFGGQGFRKPNYAFQGGGRHGMHIGSGAPFTGPAEQEGESV